MIDTPNNAPKSAFTEVGLPVWSGGDHRVAGLHFCAAAQMLIVAIVPMDAKGSNRRRIFIRHALSKGYSEVLPTSGYYFSQLVVCDSVATCFVMENAADGSFRPSAMSLPDGRLEELVACAEDPLYERQWISQLISVSADGSALYAVAGRQHRGPSGAGLIEYYLARYLRSTGVLASISMLATPFA